MNFPLARTLAPAAFLLAFMSAPSAQVLLKDDMGRSVLISKKATRIVTLAPFLTELVFAAGAGDSIVGVAEGSEYPPEAKSLPQIGTGANFAIGKIGILKPDLVLAWRDGIRREDVDQVSGYGALVYVARAHSLVDVPRLLGAIGLLTGRDVSAVVAEYVRKLEDLRLANADKPKIGAFLEIWNRPLTTISGRHFMSEALEICRADNVFNDLTGVAPQVSFQDVTARDPFVIVGAGSASSAEEFRSNWSVHLGINAVKAERLLFIDSSSILSPSVRTPEGIAQLCGELDKFRPARPAQFPRPDARRPQGGSQYGM